jgi:lipoprotein-anchoring transpeptidase ErfK/SrfK
MTFARRLAALLVAAIALVAAQPASAGTTVAFGGGYRPGSIVIVTHARELFYVTGNGQAIRYPVGVGKAGMAWNGHAQIAEKFLRPAWSPPADIALANPNVPMLIPGGSPRNPMGAAAMGLNRGNYAIHGTNNPASIGTFVSHGCIRMHNADIMDLYRRAPVGTDVYVLR